MTEELRKRITKILIAVISICMGTFQLYSVAIIPFEAQTQRSAHLAFSVAVLYLWAALEEERLLLRIFDYGMGAAGIAANIYLLLGWEEMLYRTNSMLPLDYVMAFLLIMVCLDIARRKAGIALTIIALIFIAYAYFGPYLPGVLHFSGITLRRFVATIYFGTEGIYGSCLAASATFAFMFVMFGEFLLKFGAGNFLIQISYALFGKFKGGAGKVAVVTSGLFGMVSGSAVANVASTGSLTIPLMKDSGFSPEYSGAVVSSAGAGGGLMPPVMGTAAFIMAEFIGVSYGKICVAAIMPAIIYFGALFLMVDMRARKLGLVSLKEEEIPKTSDVLKEGWQYLVCIVVLLYLLVGVRLSASKAAFWAIISLIVVDLFKSIVTKQKIDAKQYFKRYLDIFVDAAKGSTVIAATTSTAGIIIGVFVATSLNLRFSNILTAAAGGNLLLLLILSAIGTIILGMGLPTTSIYIIMSVIVAPALVQLGVPILAAHLFIFYFGCMAPVSPPVGVGFYVAAGIAKAHTMKTGLQSFKLSVAGFLVPFVFVYNQGLFFEGGVVNIIFVICTTAIGTIALSVGLEGFLYRQISMFMRTLLIVFGIATIIPEFLSSVVGTVAIIIMMGILMREKKKLVSA